MKYIKTFEIVHSYPKEGDYVILDSEQYKIINPNFYNYIQNKIVKVESIDDYNNFNIYIDQLCRTVQFQIAQIKYWSDNEEELQVYIDTKKYNI